MSTPSPLEAIFFAALERVRQPSAQHIWTRHVLMIGIYVTEWSECSPRRLMQGVSWKSLRKK